MDNILFQTATQLAQAIRERRVTVSAVIEAHLAHIAQHNPQLGAIVLLDEAGARKQAAAADATLERGDEVGPLHGVPITVKDIIDTADMRTTFGSKAMASRVPQVDATVVARLREAGAIVLGKTNIAELAGDIQCNSPIFPRGNNPWSLAHTPGGSTGGGAAAVAAGLSAMEIGTDGGGSLRIPAHYCGVYALKPTQNRVSGFGVLNGVAGDARDTQHTLVYGPLARSIEDLALCLSLIEGPDGHGFNVEAAPDDDVPLSGERPLRIAWCREFGGVPVSAETTQALEQAASQLAAAGHSVTEQTPPNFSFDEAWSSFGEILGHQVADKTPPMQRFAGRWFGTYVFRKEPTHAAIARGLRKDDARYAQNLQTRTALIASMEQFLSGCDAWLCPVASTPAFTHRPNGATRPGQTMLAAGKKVPYWVATMAYTTIFNLTGNPVVSMPVALSDDGLPISIQVVGKRWRDRELLSVAAQLADEIAPFVAPPRFT